MQMTIPEFLLRKIIMNSTKYLKGKNSNKTGLKKEKTFFICRVVYVFDSLKLSLSMYREDLVE